MPTAYFLLNVALNHEQETIDKIKQILSSLPDINYEIQGVFGVYDIILKVTAGDESQIKQIGIDSIRNMDNIQSSITMMVSD